MKAALLSRVEDHGRKLLAIFPNATERDPVKLCKKLRRLEADISYYTLMLCNGGYASGSEPLIEQKLGILAARVDALLGNGPPIHINRDPRGYALKIDDEYMRKHNIDLHRDWGGYGIIAPDLSE